VTTTTETSLSTLTATPAPATSTVTRTDPFLVETEYVTTTLSTATDTVTSTSVPPPVTSVSISTVTLPQETVTLPRETVTLPRETVTLPRETVTLPQETTTLSSTRWVERFSFRLPMQSTSPPLGCKFRKGHSQMFTFLAQFPFLRNWPPSETSQQCRLLTRMFFCNPVPGKPRTRFMLSRLYHDALRLLETGNHGLPSHSSRHCFLDPGVVHFVVQRCSFSNRSS